MIRERSDKNQVKGIGRDRPRKLVKKAHKGNGAGEPRQAKKPTTGRVLMKHLILGNPDISTDEIIEKMEQAGFTPSRFLVANQKCEFKDTLKLLKSENIDVRKLDIK